MNTRYLKPVFALGLLAIATASQAQGSYDYETIDYPGTANTSVFGVNDRGQAAGNGSDALSFPFVYDTKKGVFTDVASVAGFDETSVLGISDSGTLVGSVVSDDTLIESGVIIDKKGSATVIDHPEAISITQFRGINNKGLVTGLRDADSPIGTVLQGIIYDPKADAFTDIVPSLATIAQGISANGHVVGSAVFLPGDPDFEDPCPGLGDPAAFTKRYGWLRTPDGAVTYFSVNGLRTSARGITDSGSVAGWVLDDPVTLAARGFVTELDGSQCQAITIADEDLLAFPDAPTTFVQGIKNSGEVVGSYTDGDGFSHGYIARPQ